MKYYSRTNKFRYRAGMEKGKQILVLQIQLQYSYGGFAPKPASMPRYIWQDATLEDISETTNVVGVTV